MMGGDRVTTGGPYRMPVDTGLPCKLCGHRWDQHKCMYSVGMQDRYRCEVRTPKHDGGEHQCECGKQFELVICQVPPGSNPQQVMDALAKAHDEELLRARKRISG